MPCGENVPVFCLNLEEHYADRKSSGPLYFPTYIKKINFDDMGVVPVVLHIKRVSPLELITDIEDL